MLGENRLRTSVPDADSRIFGLNHGTDVAAQVDGGTGPPGLPSASSIIATAASSEGVANPLAEVEALPSSTQAISHGSVTWQAVDGSKWNSSRGWPLTMPQRWS